MVSIASRQQVRAVDSHLFQQIVKTLLSELQISTADLGIHLVATPEMTKLNESFLHHAGSTDVITFDYSDDARHRNSNSSPDAHGEIFICVDEAVAQARRFRTTWQSELVRYTVHGILHLQGLDDLNPAGRRKMKRAESRFLRGLAHRFPLSRLARRRAAS